MLSVFASTLMLHISCEEDLLEPKPLSFFAPENVYVNKAGFDAGLVTVRRDLKNEFYGERNPLNADVVMSDISPDRSGDMTLLTPSTGPNMPFIPIFERIYGYIKNTNVIISRIDNITWENEADRNSILAQALFFRSYWYYRLVHTYGDVPFIGEELKAAKLDFYTHSKWAILKKIQSDLEYASQWLPETAKAGTPTKYAALHLLAKVYIVNAEFDKAVQAATSVINGPYALMTTRFGSSANDPKRNVIWDLHRPENKAISQNTEAILVCIDRAEAPEGAKTNGSYTQRNFTPTWWHNAVRDSQGKQGTRDRFPDGTNTPMYDTLGRGNPNIWPAPWHTYTLWGDGVYYWRNTPDLRRADINWVDVDELLYNNPSSVDFGKPIDPRNFALIVDSMRTLWPFPHHKTWMPHEEAYVGHPMGGNGDYYVYRLAETYLIRAEAYFWKNQMDLAAADINVVRQRSNAIPVTAADIDIDFIFDERTRELYLEEMRHTEMVRASLIMAKLNIGGYSLENFSQDNWFYDRVIDRVIYYTLGQVGTWVFKIRPYHVFWPININIITANTKGVINQNVGYEGADDNVLPLEVIEE